MFTKILTFMKKEAVLCISALCAFITMVFVSPDAGYIEYIDLRVLCLLFSLMAVVAGFQRCGVFSWLTQKVLSFTRNGKALSVTLVLLPFFASMLVTNDVALLVFVPFTLGLLQQMGCGRSKIAMLVLQTVAANLGSMATPVGNPQNLYLYANYELGITDFFSAVLPYCGLSHAALILAALFVLPSKLTEIAAQSRSVEDPRKLIIYALLFVFCLLTVFRVVHYALSAAAVLLVILLMDRKLLPHLDYALLLTFVCFFVVSGNLGRIDAVRDFLQGLLNRNALLTAAGTSQIISNVPAAVLLSAFTQDWRSLLIGTNIGGLGTPIASLASLITLKLYLRDEGSQGGKFILFFLAANIAGLALLLLASLLIR